ncbi:MAG: carboxypeptidase-like regulatory domain-containing protein [Staphylococcus sp.]|nr:carboxypeptidase-like regulatory domain-containing protein [Staphylococcus sp.]
MKRMSSLSTAILVLLILLVNTSTLCASTRRQQPLTVKQQMETVRERYGVKFVYDASTKLNIPCRGDLSTSGSSLSRTLGELFKGTGLKWEVQGKYVIIVPLARYTISGYVSQSDGETAINATIFDLVTKTGTVTNEHGYYSISLPEGNHTLQVSSFGCGEKVETVRLDRNMTLNVTLSPGEELQEVVVTADLNSPLATTQTGKISLSAKDLKREYALMSSPDVVKIIQNLSGVAAGTELISGLYVHGGGNDENLFMLDGTPLYQINHLGGLFSAFNTDVINNIDFYKSGFPARYGGRLSSVVDVRTRDGNMSEYHGSFSIGLIDGRIQFEGPIVKNRTSFNFGMRRTWLDVLTIPAFAIYNHTHKDEESKMRYAFHDINAKITHIFSPRSRADISLYSGEDVFSAKDKYYPTEGMADDNEYSKLKLKWGNLTAALNWKYSFSPKLYTVFTAIYTHNRSYQNYIDSYKTYNPDDDYAVVGIVHNENSSRATINDFGARMETDYRPGQTHHIRAGANYLMHFFKPQNSRINNFVGDGTTTDSMTNRVYHSLRGHELAVYAEDNIAVAERWRVNIGLHFALFNIPGKTYASPEPRLALRYQASDRVTLKASYTRMSQYMHQLSNSYLNLPTDYWVPSTATVAPSKSDQYAAGVYVMLPAKGWQMSAEGFYKSTRNLIEYDGGNSLTPSFDNWDSHVRRGRGRSYGMELEAGYGNGRMEVSGSYTLSWNKRNFPGFHHGWFSDKFDNRHKLNLNMSYKLREGIDVYAAWSFHSGNRITVPEQLAVSPVIPSPGGNRWLTGGMDPGQYEWIYDKPNNITLAPYHRLDLGINFRKMTKRGHERIWNISIYNAYCRMNPFSAKIVQKPDGSFKGKATAIFPIIPSFSYTLKF